VRKEVISTTTITLQGVIYPAYHTLRNAAGTRGEKSPHKIPTTGALMD
jgi:hypothetical protein